MARKILWLMASFALMFVLSCGTATPSQEEAMPGIETPALQKTAGPVLEISNWRIENKFSDGLRLVVDVKHNFPLNFASSGLNARVGDGSIHVAPESDPENQTAGRMVFKIGDNNKMHTWTEFDSGTVEIIDEQGNKVVFETGPFVYSDPRFKWKEQESENIKVLFYGSASGVNPEKVLSEAERILGNFSFTPDKKIRIIVYESRRDIDVAIPFRSNATKERLITLGMAFKDIDAVFVLRTDEFFNTTRHELMHLVFDHLTDGLFVTMPTWLNEGLSMYAGDENLSAEENSDIEKAIANKEFLSLRQMSSFSGDPRTAILGYAEAHSFVRFLIKGYGYEAMLNTFLSMRKDRGMALEEAVEKAYGKSLDSLEKEWVHELTAASG